MIDANDIRNKRNDHEIGAIVFYFAIDLIALILLLILFYILCEEMDNLYQHKMMETEPEKTEKIDFDTPTQRKRIKNALEDDDDNESESSSSLNQNDSSDSIL